MTTLLVWRHGETDWNATDRVQGQTDVPLSTIGEVQAQAAAFRLAALKPTRIVSSDLSRAASSAAALAALTGLEVALDERLRERHFGEWQGHRVSKIAERWPEKYARWRAGDAVSGLGLENVEDLAKRVAAALRDAADEATDGTVVVVTHGGAARHGCAMLLGWPEAAARTLGGLNNCHWSELRFDAVRGWQLRAHNVG